MLYTVAHKMLKVAHKTEISKKKNETSLLKQVHVKTAAHIL